MMGQTTRACCVADGVVSAASQMVACNGQALAAFDAESSLAMGQSSWALSLALGPLGAKAARKTLMYDNCAAWFDAELRFFKAPDVRGLQSRMSEKPLTDLDFPDVDQAAPYPFAQGELATTSARTYPMPYARAFQSVVMECAKSGRGMVLVTA